MRRLRDRLRGVSYVHPQDALRKPYVARKRVNGVELQVLIATEEGRLWYDPQPTSETSAWDALELDYTRSLGLIEPGGVVYDVGANHGVLSLFFASELGPEGRVYAFDPLAPNVEIIRRNAEINGFSNITAIQAAVGDRTANLWFDSDRCSVLADEDVEAVRSIPGRRLEELPGLRLDDFDAPPPTLVKIDVEGSEAAVLRGATKLFEHKPHIHLELHPSFLRERYGETVDDVLALVDWDGYSLYAARPQAGHVLEPWDPRDPVVDDDQTTGAWLFARYERRAG